MLTISPSPKSRILEIYFHCLMPAFVLPVRQLSNAAFCLHKRTSEMTVTFKRDARSPYPKILCELPDRENGWFGTEGLSLTRLYLYFKSLKMTFLLRLRRMKILIMIYSVIIADSCDLRWTSFWISRIASSNPAWCMNVYSCFHLRV
jgi:hypothetical protein